MSIQRNTADEELIDLFAKAHTVELECPLPPGCTLDRLKVPLIACAVYVDNRELPGIYHVGPIRKALISASHAPVSWRYQVGHFTWTWQARH
jgi:hypothetical protein